MEISIVPGYKLHQGDMARYAARPATEKSRIGNELMTALLGKFPFRQIRRWFRFDTSAIVTPDPHDPDEGVRQLKLPSVRAILRSELPTLDAKNVSFGRNALSANPDPATYNYDDWSVRYVPIYPRGHRTSTTMPLYDADDLKTVFMLQTQSTFGPPPGGAPRVIRAEIVVNVTFENMIPRSAMPPAHWDDFVDDTLTSLQQVLFAAGGGSHLRGHNQSS